MGETYYLKVKNTVFREYILIYSTFEWIYIRIKLRREMKKSTQNILDTVGNTPLARLVHVTKGIWQPSYPRSIVS